jgi:hypothetical protein
MQSDSRDSAGWETTSGVCLSLTRGLSDRDDNVLVIQDKLILSEAFEFRAQRQKIFRPSLRHVTQYAANPGGRN